MVVETYVILAVTARLPGTRPTVLPYWQLWEEVPVGSLCPVLSIDGGW
jgi:hypothetical protein